MSAPLPATPVLPPAWSDVLDNVLQALDQTADQAARRAQALEGPPFAGELNSPWQQALPAWSQRVEQLNVAIVQANRTVAETDAVLAAAEQATQEWLARIAAAARRLAAGAGSAV